MTEAALIAVPMPHVKHLADDGSPLGRTLLTLKEDVSRPISAILILNTIANTAGPAIAGSAVEDLFGGTGLAIFAGVLSVFMLFVGEMIPKFIGVSYSKQIAPLCALPLSLTIVALWPLVWVSSWITKKIEPHEDKPSISEEEVLSMAAIGAEEGTLDQLEGSVITNVIGLDKLMVKDILTPRVNVFRVDESLTLDVVARQIPGWNFTRVPVFSNDDPDHLTGYVRQRDIYREVVKGELTKTLKDVARPLEAVPEFMRIDKLMLQMLEHREHICSVVDEHGALAGVITLEDILEEMVGQEIVDEYDDARARR